MEDSPSTTGPNGRDSKGRFAPGNRASMGNPHARRVAKLRSALLREVSTADLRQVVRKLLAVAKEGDIQASKLLIDRVLGPAVPIDIIERLENLESTLRESEQ